MIINTNLSPTNSFNESNNKLVNSLKKPCNYIAKIFTDHENIFNRLFHASVPFLYSNRTFSRYYTWITRVSSIKSKSKTTYSELSSLIRSYRENGLSKENALKSAKMMVGIAYFIFCMVNPHWGWIISSGFRAGICLNRGIVQLKQKEYRPALNEFYHSTTSGITCAASIRSHDKNLSILSHSVQILSSFEGASKQCHRGRYIETASNLGMAFKGGYHLVPQIRAAYPSVDKTIEVTQAQIYNVFRKKTSTS